MYDCNFFKDPMIGEFFTKIRAKQVFDDSPGWGWPWRGKPRWNPISSFWRCHSLRRCRRHLFDAWRQRRRQHRLASLRHTITSSAEASPKKLSHLGRLLLWSHRFRETASPVTTTTMSRLLTSNFDASNLTNFHILLDLAIHWEICGDNAGLRCGPGQLRKILHRPIPDLHDPASHSCIEDRSATLLLFLK